MVQSQAVVYEGRLGLSILERPHPGTNSSPLSPLLLDVDEHTWIQTRNQTQSWALHWFWIEVDDWSLSIESSHLPTVPVFLTCNGGAARADWDPLRLYPFLQARLNWEAAAYYLSTFDQPYSNITVFEDLYHLAGGYRAHWQGGGGGWKWDRPASSPPSYPRALSLQADPIRTFESLLAASTDRLVGSLRGVATGLSGGLDSTLVTGILARQGHEVNSFGILVPGNDVDGQIRRRTAAIKQFEIKDQIYPVRSDYSPWSRKDRYGMVPWEELYFAPFDDLYARAAASGHQVFFTGLGGDDLLATYWDEQPDRGYTERRVLMGESELPDFFTPRVRDGRIERARAQNDLSRSFAQRSVLDSASGMAAQTLRHGLWPIHPLITPELVRYCHALPFEYRRERKLMRDTLARWGLPKLLSHPESTESFEKTCWMAMRSCPEFLRLLRAPHLADLGLVEPARVQQAFQTWHSQRMSSSEGLHFVAIATLEATLESVE